MEKSVLTRQCYGVVDNQATAHLTLATDSETTYCGKKVTGPVPEGGWKNKAGYHIGEHCIECDKAHRASTGTYAVCYEF